MESMLTLARVLGNPGSSLPARKLQPAFYLAQEHANHQVYAYRVRQGKVVSDELDQDLAQLSSGGIVAVLCSIHDHSPEVAVLSSFPSAIRVDDSAEPLRAKLRDLLMLDDLVLNAAATLTFFNTRHGREPNGELQWFRSLSEATLEEAKTLCVSAS